MFWDIALRDETRCKRTTRYKRIREKINENALFTLLLTFGLAFFGWMATANAKQITFRFAGTMDVSNIDFAVGDPYFGFYTFESTIPGGSQNDPTLNRGYADFDGTWEVVFPNKGYIYTGTFVQIAVGNNTSLGDRYIVTMSAEEPFESIGTPLPSNFGLSFFQIDLIDTGADLLNDDSIQTTPLDLSLVQAPSGRFVYRHSSGQPRHTPTELTLESPPPDILAIDIKPGSFPNSINLGSGGATPVAILGDGILDLMDINLDTLTFGSNGIKTVGRKDHQLCSFEDVSGDFVTMGLEGFPDGELDLVCHFVTFNIVPEAGDTQVKISGDFISGGSFEGFDSVIIVP